MPLAPVQNANVTGDTNETLLQHFVMDHQRFFQEAAPVQVKGWVSKRILRTKCLGFHGPSSRAELYLRRALGMAVDLRS
jgi:hypothetical protein